MFSIWHLRQANRIYDEIEARQRVVRALEFAISFNSPVLIRVEDYPDKGSSVDVIDVVGRKESARALADQATVQIKVLQQQLRDLGVEPDADPPDARPPPGPAS